MRHEQNLVRIRFLSASEAYLNMFERFLFANFVLEIWYVYAPRTTKGYQWRADDACQKYQFMPQANIPTSRKSFASRGWIDNTPK